MRLVPLVRLARIDVRIDGEGVRVAVRGWYRLIAGQIRLTATHDQIIRAEVAERGGLEAAVTAREAGFGTNRGTSQRGRLRLGGFLCQGLLGRQFWAVGPCDESTPLLLLHLHDVDYRSVHGPVARAMIFGPAPYKQAVLEVPDPHAAAADLNELGSAQEG